MVVSLAPRYPRFKFAIFNLALKIALFLSGQHGALAMLLVAQAPRYPNSSVLHFRDHFGSSTNF